MGRPGILMAARVRAPLWLLLVSASPALAQGTTGLSGGVGLAGTFLRERQYGENLYRQFSLQLHRRLNPRIAIAVEYLGARNIVPQGCDLVGICAPPVEFQAGAGSLAWTPKGSPLLSAGVGLYWLTENAEGERMTSPGVHGELELPLRRLTSRMSLVVRLRTTIVPVAPSAPITMVALSIGFRAWLG